jgi:hypothetical protein
MEYFQVMRSAYDLRYALLPYIYTYARQAYDTGISLCSPLYYNWPENEESYTFKNEYMFGDSLLVNPIVAQMENGKKYISQKTWLPKGQWIEYTTGKVFEGPLTIERPFALDEIPVYVKAGAIIPMMTKMKRVDEKPLDPMILNIYPGSKGSVSVYEDAGNDQGYKDGKFAFTDINFTNKDNKTIVTINPIRGKYDNMPDSRGYQLRLVNTFPPKSVLVNGQKTVYSQKPADNGWNYDGDEIATIIYVGNHRTSKQIKIEIEQNDSDTTILSGLKGKIKHLHSFVEYVGRTPKPLYQFEPIISTALTGRKMTYAPSKAADIVVDFETDYQKAIEIIKTKASQHKDWLPYLEWLQID